MAQLSVTYIAYAASKWGLETIPSDVQQMPCVMPRKVIYSTNAYLKFVIAEQLLKGRHYVWCSECFDAASQGAYTLTGSSAPSSNPADIYRQLDREVKGTDRHSQKIKDMQVRLLALAAKLKKDGVITITEAAEMAYMVKNAVLQDFRPLLYIIPTVGLNERIEVVPMKRRASLGPEYIVSDLARAEFDILEFKP